MARNKQKFTIYETRTHLSRLLRRVEKGEELLVARGSKVIARIVPADLPLGPRQPGSAKDKFKLTGDFDAPLPDEFLKFFN